MLRRHFTLAVLGSVAALALPGLASAEQPKPAAPAQGLTADQVVERVQAFYDRTKTFKSRFKQRYWVKAHNKTKDSAGDVIFQKPGKMSWRYTSNGNRVVSDGKVIKVYEKENKQMYEQPLEKSQYPAALAFLTGSGNLKQAFKFELADPKQMGFEGGYVLVGVPREATPAYQKIFMFVDVGTFQVRRVLMLDAQGNRNRFDFEQPEVNVKAPPNEFTFTPPPGTQIIRP